MTAPTRRNERQEHMREWKPGDKIVFTFPLSNNTYLFIFEHVKENGLLRFKRVPQGSGDPAEALMAISAELAQVAWDSNQAAKRSLNEPAFSVNCDGYLKYVIDHGSAGL